MKKSTVIICPGYSREPHKCKVSDFYKDENRRGGGHSRLCKECHKAYGRDYFKQEYYPKNREKLIGASTMNREKRKHGGHLTGLRDDLSKGRGALYRLRSALHEADVMDGGPGYSQTRMADEIGLGIAWYRTCEREGKLPDNRAVRANIERLAKEAGVDLSEGE